MSLPNRSGTAEIDSLLRIVEHRLHEAREQVQGLDAGLNEALERVTVLETAQKHLRSARTEMFGEEGQAASSDTLASSSS